MGKISILWVFLFLLTSCIWDSDEIMKAKQDLGVIEWGVSQEVVVNKNPQVQDSSIEIPTMWDFMEVEWDPRIQLTQISGKKLLELDELNYSEFKNGYSKITWRTLWQVDKIIVSFSNDESDFPSDGFTLQKFKWGDATFEYNASSKFKVLDFGVNQYRFVAYSGTEKSTLELLVVVSEDDKRVLEGNSQVSERVEDTDIGNWINNSSNFDQSDFPTGADFWNIVKLGWNSFTYSDIKGLEINKVSNVIIDCSNTNAVTAYIKENLAKWPYWNTCRSIVKGNGIYLYVTKMDNNEYVYEKHYFDQKNWLHWSYELERGELYSSDETLSVTERDSLLWQKDEELKAQNSSFTQQVVTDNLFKKIAQ